MCFFSSRRLQTRCVLVMEFRRVLFRSSLHRRTAEALAELTGGPAALLRLPDAQGGFRIAEAWRWPDALDPEAFGGEAALSLRCAFMLQETQHIVDIDALRRGGGQMTEELSVPAWMVSREGVDRKEVA